MNPFPLFILSAFSIALPAVAGLFRVRPWYHRYLAFSVLLWIGLLNEVLSYLMIRHHKNNHLNANLYSGMEFLFILYFFRKINNTKSNHFSILGILSLPVWIADNWVLHSLDGDNALFRLLAGFCILYLGINRITQLVLEEDTNPCKRTEMWICISLLIHFMYKSFLTIFILFPMQIPVEFYTGLWLIFSVVNLATNLIYFIIILWISKPKAFTLP